MNLILVLYVIYGCLDKWWRMEIWIGDSSFARARKKRVNAVVCFLNMFGCRVWRKLRWCYIIVVMLVDGGIICSWEECWVVVASLWWRRRVTRRIFWWCIGCRVDWILNLMIEWWYWIILWGDGWWILGFVKLCCWIRVRRRRGTRWFRWRIIFDCTFLFGIFWIVYFEMCLWICWNWDSLILILIFLCWCLNFWRCVCALNRRITRKWYNWAWRMTLWCNCLVYIVVDWWNIFKLLLVLFLCIFWVFVLGMICIVVFRIGTSSLVRCSRLFSYIFKLVLLVVLFFLCMLGLLLWVMCLVCGYLVLRRCCIWSICFWFRTVLLWFVFVRCCRWWENWWCWWCIWWFLLFVFVIVL